MRSPFRDRECEGKEPKAGKFDGESALRYAKAQLDFGPRIPGTPGAQRRATGSSSEMKQRADTRDRADVDTRDAWTESSFRCGTFSRASIRPRPIAFYM